MQLDLERQQKLDRFFSVFEFLFKAEFLLFGFLGYNSFTFGHPVMSVFVMITTAMAGVLLLYRVFHFKDYIHNKFIWLLILFLGSFAVSLLVNRQYGGIGNGVKAAAWMGMQYLLLFLYNPKRSVEKDKREFKYISWVFVIYMILGVLVSLVFLFANQSFIFKIGSPNEEVYVYAGLLWGRLWGIFTDPNYGSVMAVVSVLLSYYFYRLYKNKGIRAFLIINIILQILYVVFSDSRTGIVSMLIGFSVCGYLTLRSCEKIQLKAFAKQSVCVLCALIIAVSCWFVPQGVKKGYNTAVSYFYQQQGSSEDEPGEKEEPLLGREGDIENDYSNRRFDLWKSGFEIFKTSPVLGVSHFNVVEYAKVNLPNTYLIDNDYSPFDNFHNAYINILVGQGLVGFAIAIVFTAFAGLYILIHLWKSRNVLESYLITLFSVILAVGFSTMFVSDVFYVNSPCATMFWLSLGYAIHLVEKNYSMSKEVQ